MNDPSTPASASQLDARLPESIRQIIQAIYAEKDLSPAKVKKILKEAQVKQEELIPWAQFDHDPKDSYGRQMIYDGGFFDMMVMSWNPGDFSAIHDHGYSQWGAVQVFGEAEHAVFLVQDNSIQTLSRNIMKPGQVIGVGHQLVHQMGNPHTNQRYVSLHVYGCYERDNNVTGDARLFDLEAKEIHRIDGGVFFALPPEGIKMKEVGPEADFLTQLRHRVELIRRLQKMQPGEAKYQGEMREKAIEALFDEKYWSLFIQDLEEHLDDKGHHTHSVFWKLLNWELKAAATLQNELSLTAKKDDSFQHYADLYDEVIGKPCRDGFMADY
ncbi:MAG: cysteine dioxygenase family protein, partial [Bacteroidota bacterium]